MLPIVKIWTDGSCKGNPGPGGWAALLIDNYHEETLYGGELLTTNNRMELTAPIEALQTLKKPYQVIIYTDSIYVVKGMTEWLVNWKNTNWKNSKKEEIKNIDLWKLLDKQTSFHKITWNWIRGHNGDINNERVDELANFAVKNNFIKNKKI